MTLLAVGTRFSQFLGGALPRADTEAAESSRKSTLRRVRSVRVSLRELTLSFVLEAERVAIGKYGKWLRCTRSHLVVYNQQVRESSGRRIMAI